MSTVWKFSEIVHLIGNIGLHQILHSSPVQRSNICKEQCDNGTKQDGSSRVKLIRVIYYIDFFLKKKSEYEEIES